MITAAHSVENLWKIAINKLQYRKRITAALLRVAFPKRNPEYRNILIGKTIVALDQYYDLIQDKKPVLAFVGCQLSNSRSTTRKRAEALLKKNGKEQRRSD
jgi:hypothetical protein